MSFLGLIVKNLVRQRVRTALTLLGISIGITTVIALAVVTTSLKETAGQIVNLGGADFIVAQNGAADLTLSIVSEKDEAGIATYPGVARADGVLFHVTQLGSNPFFFMVGRSDEALAASPLPLRAGSPWEPGRQDGLLLGNGAAEDLGLGVGDQLTIDRATFTVTGIYQTGRVYEDAGAYGPLRAVQDLAARAGVVTAVFVKAAGGQDPRALAAAIEADFPNLTTISNIDEYGKVDQGVQMLDAANIAISALAILIGGIGVMNTMVMSVFERTREIGILRAVGWSGNRILRMVIGESLLLCAGAAGVGAALAVLATQLLLLNSTVSSLLVPQYTPAVFVRGLVVAVAVALAGAAYPAFRAVRLTPMAALRYE